MAKKSIPRTPVELSEDDAERLLADFKSRPALFKKKIVFELDAAICKDKFGATRRMALLLLTKTGRGLMKAVEGDREFAVAVADVQNDIQRYANALRDLLSWIEEADRRSLMALAMRPDMEAVLAEVAHG